MIPLKDYNPTRRFAYITALLIALNVGVYIFVQRPFSSNAAKDATFSYQYAAIPCEVVTGRPLTDGEIRQTFEANDNNACDRSAHPTKQEEDFPNKNVKLAILYSMFLHASWLHIGGNMLFLWIFGNNIEDRMGRVAYLLFYLVAGVVAAAVDIAVQPNSTLPVIGASGAIAGVMGAYLVVFPNVKIKTLLLVFLVDVPARTLLLFWFVLQFFTGSSEGVAWVAHVGGFVFGAIVGLLVRERLRPTEASLPAL